MMKPPAPPSYGVALEIVDQVEKVTVWAATVPWWQGAVLRCDPRFVEDKVGDYDAVVSIDEAVLLNRRFGAAVENWVIPEVLALEATLRGYSAEAHVVQVAVFETWSR